MFEDTSCSPPQCGMPDPAGQPEKPETIGLRPVAVARGAAWMLEGFDHFKASPGGWIAALAVLFLISLAASLVPFGDLVLTVLNPVLTAGLMAGCHAQRQGESFTVGHLFAGFTSERVGQLLFIGAILLGVGLIIVAVVVAVAVLSVIDVATLLSGLSVEQIGREVEQRMLADPEQLLLPLGLMLLVLFGLFVPLVMALWFAPPLVILNRVDAGEAMELSFNGCLINIAPFMLYGIVAPALLLVSMIPLGLGLLVTLPMMSASLYIAYRDIFIG